MEAVLVVMLDNFRTVLSLKLGVFDIDYFFRRLHNLIKRNFGVDLLLRAFLDRMT